MVLPTALFHTRSETGIDICCVDYEAVPRRASELFRSQFRVLSCSHDNEKHLCEVMCSLLILTNTCSQQSLTQTIRLHHVHRKEKGSAWGMSERFQDASNQLTGPIFLSVGQEVQKLER